MLQLSLFADLFGAPAPVSAPARPAPPGPAPAAPAPRPRGAGSEQLLARLTALGLPPFPRLTTHRNEQVMISWTPGRVFRVHEGYADAPDEVLRAIVRFVTPGMRRASRLDARKVFLAFPAERYAPRVKKGPPKVRPTDRPVIEKLRQLHAALNARHFGAELQPITIRLSGRMERRLGELRLERATGRPVHIAISRAHLRRDGWLSVADTLLHEMVHQWQAETGRPVDHGSEFRQKALAVGIEPRAVRQV